MFYTQLNKVSFYFSRSSKTQLNRHAKSSNNTRSIRRRHRRQLASSPTCKASSATTKSGKDILSCSASVRVPSSLLALIAFPAAQKVLERQRFPFPSDWVYFEQVDGEWSAFSDILSRKDSAIQGQVSALQEKIRQEVRYILKCNQSHSKHFAGHLHRAKDGRCTRRMEEVEANRRLFDAHTVH